MDSHSKTLMNALSEKQRKYALSRYENKKKSVAVAYLLWFVFGVYYFYLNRILLNLLLWFSVFPLFFFGALAGFPLLGFAWFFIDLFRIPGLVEQRNRDILIECIKDAKTVFND